MLCRGGRSGRITCRRRRRRLGRGFWSGVFLGRLVRKDIQEGERYRERERGEKREMVGNFREVVSLV